MQLGNVFEAFSESSMSGRCALSLFFLPRCQGVTIANCGIRHAYVIHRFPCWKSVAKTMIGINNKRLDRTWCPRSHSLHFYWFESFSILVCLVVHRVHHRSLLDVDCITFQYADLVSSIHLGRVSLELCVGRRYSSAGAAPARPSCAPTDHFAT